MSTRSNKHQILLKTGEKNERNARDKCRSCVGFPALAHASRVFGISRKQLPVTLDAYEGTECTTRTNSEHSRPRRCISLLPHSLALLKALLMAQQWGTYRLLPTSILPTSTDLHFIPMVPAVSCHQAAQMQKRLTASLQRQLFHTAQ